MESAKHCTDTCNQFFGVERFDDVIVCSKFQSQDFVKGFSFGGKHDDRYIGSMTDLTTYLVSVNARKHQIQKNQIRVKNMELLQGFLAVIYDLGLKAFFCEIESYQLCNVVVIVNNEDFLFCSHGFRSFFIS